MPPNKGMKLTRPEPLWVRLGAYGIVLLVAADRVGDRVCAGNRRTVIDTMGRLRKGMPHADVLSIVEPHESRFFLRQEADGTLQYWTHAGLVSDWSLGLTFAKDGPLEAARVSTEDGPYHPHGVPADIR